MFFQGEMMECDLCGRRQRSDPTIESGWTVVQLDDVNYYVCTNHINSQTRNYEKAWRKILRRLIAKHNKRKV